MSKRKDKTDAAENPSPRRSFPRWLFSPRGNVLRRVLLVAAAAGYAWLVCSASLGVVFSALDPVPMLVINSGLVFTAALAPAIAVAVHLRGTPSYKRRTLIPGTGYALALTSLLLMVNMGWYVVVVMVGITWITLHWASGAPLWRGAEVVSADG